MNNFESLIDIFQKMRLNAFDNISNYNKIAGLFTQTEKLEFSTSGNQYLYTDTYNKFFNSCGRLCVSGLEIFQTSFSSEKLIIEYNEEVISEYSPAILKVLIEVSNRLKTEFRHPYYTDKSSRINVKVEDESYTYLMSRGEGSGDIIEAIIGRGGITFMKSTFTILHSSFR